MGWLNRLTDSDKRQIDVDFFRAPGLAQPSEQGFVRIGLAAVFAFFVWGGLLWVILFMYCLPQIPQSWTFVILWFTWTGEIFLLTSAVVIFRFLLRWQATKDITDTGYKWRTRSQLLAGIVKWISVWAVVSTGTGLVLAFFGVPAWDFHSFLLKPAETRGR